jgi:hypothetical protein
VKTDNGEDPDSAHVIDVLFAIYNIEGLLCVRLMGRGTIWASFESWAADPGLSQAWRSLTPDLRMRLWAGIQVRIYGTRGEAGSELKMLGFPCYKFFIRM